VNQFLDAAPSDSPLWDWAPPGPAVGRREWCRLEEAGAVEYVDPMAPRPGRHRMTISSQVEYEDGIEYILGGLGGRRVRCWRVRDVGGDGLGGLAPGDSVQVEIRTPRAKHYVTPSGLHLVGTPTEGYETHAEINQARDAAGETQVRIVSRPTQSVPNGRIEPVKSGE